MSNPIMKFNFFWNSHNVPFLWTALKIGWLRDVWSKVGESNGPIQFKSARKFWPLLEFLARFARSARLLVLAKFLNCSHARILVKIHCRVLSGSIICFSETKIDSGNNVSCTAKLGNVRKHPRVILRVF